MRVPINPRHFDKTNFSVKLYTKFDFTASHFLGIASSFTAVSRTKEEVLCPPLAETVLTQTPFLQRTNRRLRKRKSQALNPLVLQPKHLCNVEINAIKCLVFVK